MRKRDIEFIVKVGSKKTISLTLTDDTGTIINMSSSATYNTGKWKVWKPDGTLLINGSVIFLDRTNGVISYDLVAADTVTANAGVWEGEVEILNDDPSIEIQSNTFTFTIEESF